MKNAGYVIGGGVLVALVGLGLWLWTHPSAPPPAPIEEPAAAAVTPAPPAASAPAIQHPIAAASEAAGSAPPRDVETVLTELFGPKSVHALFQLDGFARRVAATVDNLGRSHAPARLWPLNPTAGRFTVDQRGGAQVVGADNGLRYTPYVLLLESVDLRRLVAAYTSMYPQFQQAYEDLGYPHGYFNDRLVEVIDLLLATPDASDATRVHLPAINGPVQPTRPWVLYEFDDPALQSLAAGQRILLRMGPVNQRRVKAKLAEIRRLLTAGGPGR
jgi:hypothetical protein